VEPLREPTTPRPTPQGKKIKREGEKGEGTSLPSSACISKKEAKPGRVAREEASGGDTAIYTNEKNKRRSKDGPTTLPLSSPGNHQEVGRMSHAKSQHQLGDSILNNFRKKQMKRKKRKCHCLFLSKRWPACCRRK